ncbi:MAG: glycosyltransferase [Roseburia sp.]|nr:glycosyltransferase [Roseburia sp.]MCM1278120.1 glycosyltransferase [Robinsoniella sp.]
MDYAVLMSVYWKENPEFLKQSIESIFRQTILPKQFILVKDGPLTKELEDAISFLKHEGETEYSIQFTIVALPQNAGLGPALNQGLEKAEYEYIARMDSDDIAFPNRCELQLQVFAKKQVDIVSGTVLEFGKDTKEIQAVKSLPEEQEEILKYAKRRNPFNHPCVMFRRQVILQAGMYQDVRWFEDYDLWVRALMQGAKGYNTKEPLLYMRAGSDMYLRRGGLKYVGKGIAFRWKLRKIGFSGNRDFLVSVCGQIFMGLMPNGLRKKFYKKILRR